MLAWLKSLIWGANERNSVPHEPYYREDMWEEPSLGPYRAGPAEQTSDSPRSGFYHGYCEACGTELVLIDYCTDCCHECGSYIVES